MTALESIPPEGAPEYFDCLLDGLEAEVRLSERYSIELESVAFYRRMLRAAYQRALLSHEVVLQKEQED